MPAVHRKLVPDRIPEIIQSNGRRPVTRVLEEGSYRQALLAKLREEAQGASHATADDLPGELAGVLEVLRALTVTAVCPGRNSSRLPTISAIGVAASEEGSSSKQWNETPS
jgi:predicted house-cleaning noncanonical NTP pyrophosphatase (MazG superfamily)